VAWSYEIRNVAVTVPPMPLVANAAKHSGKVVDITGLPPPTAPG
jgi:hypothetical protein